MRNVDLEKKNAERKMHGNENKLVNMVTKIRYSCTVEALNVIQQLENK